MASLMATWGINNKFSYMLETLDRRHLPKRKNDVVETISRQDLTLNITKDIAYLLGVYLSDGSISACNFQLQVTDKDFADRTMEVLRRLVPTTKAYVRVRNERTSWNKSDRYVIKVGIGELAKVFVRETNSKHHIPFDMFNAQDGIKREFIAGIMDGDGWISMAKRPYDIGKYQYRIGIGGVEEGWIYEFHQLLQSMGVKCGKLDRSKTDKGTPFVRFHVRPKTFFDAGLYFTIERKQKRCEIASTTAR